MLCADCRPFASSLCVICAPGTRVVGHVACPLRPGLLQSLARGSRAPGHDGARIMERGRLIHYHGSTGRGLTEGPSGGVCQASGGQEQPGQPGGAPSVTRAQASLPSRRCFYFTLNLAVTKDGLLPGVTTGEGLGHQEGTELSPAMCIPPASRPCNEVDTELHSPRPSR